MLPFPPQPRSKAPVLEEEEETGAEQSSSLLNLGGRNLSGPLAAVRQGLAENRGPLSDPLPWCHSWGGDTGGTRPPSILLALSPGHQEHPGDPEAGGCRFGVLNLWGYIYGAMSLGAAESLGVTHPCAATAPAAGQAAVGFAAPAVGSQVQRRRRLGGQGSVQAAGGEQGVADTWTDRGTGGRAGGTEGRGTIGLLSSGLPGDADGGPGALVPGGCPCVRARRRAPAKPHPERTWAAVATPGPLRPRPCAASGNEGDGRIWPREPAGCKAPRPDPAAGCPRGSAPRGAAGGHPVAPPPPRPGRCHLRWARSVPTSCPGSSAEPWRLSPSWLWQSHPPPCRPPPCHLLPTRGGAFHRSSLSINFSSLFFCCPSPGWQKLGGRPAAPSPAPVPPGTRLQL